MVFNLKIYIIAAIVIVIGIFIAITWQELTYKPYDKYFTDSEKLGSIGDVEEGIVFVSIYSVEHRSGILGPYAVLRECGDENQECVIDVEKGDTLFVRYMLFVLGEPTTGGYLHGSAGGSDILTLLSSSAYLDNVGGNLGSWVPNTPAEENNMRTLSAEWLPYSIMHLSTGAHILNITHGLISGSRTIYLRIVREGEGVRLTDALCVSQTTIRGTVKNEGKIGVNTGKLKTILGDYDPSFVEAGYIKETPNQTEANVSWSSNFIPPGEFADFIITGSFESLSEYYVGIFQINRLPTETIVSCMWR